MYAVVHLVWVKNYERLEQQEVRTNVKWVRQLWHRDREQLATIVGDWAPWDELYDFARQPQDRKFIGDNLTAEAMANLRADAVFATDDQGSSLFFQSRDAAWEQAQGASFLAAWRQELQSREELRQELQAGKCVSGAAMLGGEPVLLAAQQIVHSDKSGPSAGVLVMMRRLEGGMLAELARTLEARLTVQAGTAELAGLSWADDHWQEVPAADRLRAYVPLTGLSGETAVVLSLETDRLVHREVQQQYTYFFLLTAAVLAVSIFISIRGLEVLVARRLRKIDAFLQGVRELGAPAGKLELASRDELGQVATNINQMLARIAASHRKIEELNASLQRELAERRRAEEALRYSSWHDGLTGLHNRAYLEKVLEGHVAGGAAGVGVICGDLDGLKIINDTLGHATGDAMLRQAADIFRRYVPEGAVAVRTGGDEFLVLLTGVEEQQLLDICRRIRDAAREERRTELPLQISLGWQYRRFCAPGGGELAKLIREADDAMYREKLRSKQSTRNVVVQAILKMIEVRDFSAKGHAQRIRRWVLALAERLRLTPAQQSRLLLLAQFRDIGKMGLAEQVLLKEGPLTTAERKEIERHAEIGHRIALVIPELEEVADLILTHHEWWDGGGYPLGLREEAIPVESRLIAVVDAYDAMTSDSSYRQALSHAQALEELRRGRGGQFDPVVLDVFLELMDGCSGGEEEQPRCG